MTLCGDVYKRHD